MTVPVECPEMVDTLVLVYASMTTSRTTKDPAAGARHETCLDLLRRLPSVRVSAIAWLEYTRLLRPDEYQRMEPILRKVVVERLDRPIVEFAGELLRKRRATEHVCPRCLGSDRSETCAKCGKRYSAQQRLNDALIVSTAQVLETVETLWSFDGGVHELGRYCASCQVRRPQSDTPLLDPEENRALAAASGTSRLVSVPPSSLGTAAADDDEPG
jgi:predicted nucleic acid-binding protein